MSLALRGRLTSNDDNGNNSNGKEFWFENEHDKKTSFIFDESSSLSSSSASMEASKGEISQRIVIEKPCHLFLDCCIRNSENDNTNGGTTTTTTTAFLFGGLEIHSNSRNIEVYTMDDDGDGNDGSSSSKSAKTSFEYLKTCRGTILTDDERN